MNLKRNITFQLEARKKNGMPIVENVPIRMRVVFGGKRIEFTTGYRIDISKWDATKQRVKNGCTNKLKQTYSEINADLNRYEAEIQSVFKEYEISEMMPTTEQIKVKFNTRIAISCPGLSGEKSGMVSQKSFWEIYDEFTKECGRKNDWTRSTFEKFAAFKKHLLKFKRGKISFDTFTENGLNDLVEHFRLKCNMLNSTIGKQLGYLKWFLRWASEKGYNTNRDYATFKPKLKNTQAKVIFLTDEELEKIGTFEIPAAKSHLEKVRDVLIFCCYSGLRYSDVANLRKSDVYEDHIEVTTVKTADSLTVELNNRTRKILDKYKDEELPGQKALPVISNQKMNDYIKDLGELAGINTPVRITQYRGNERIDTVYPKFQLLCTHTGRKTFICKALGMGIPVNVVMQWTGHSDYKAMKPYIAIADSIRVASMKLFNN